MRRFLTLTTTLLAIALALPAGAEHCTTYSTSSPEIDTGETDAGRFYVDNDTCFGNEGCMISVWVYQESNGIDGLQRGDEVVDDTCHNMIYPDTLDA